MTSASPKSLASILQQRSDHLSMLLSQVRLLRLITTVIKDALPDPLSKHCHAANIDGNTLIVGCDSSTWAAKLRYHLPYVMDRLKVHRNIPACRHIRVKVQPLDLRKPNLFTRQPKLMTEDSAALIASVAHNTTDPKLRAALLRLSQRTKLVKNR